MTPGERLNPLTLGSKPQKVLSRGRTHCVVWLLLLPGTGAGCCRAAWRAYQISSVSTQTRVHCLLKPQVGQHTWAGSELNYGRPTILPVGHLFLVGRGCIWELWLWGSFFSREALGRSREEVSLGACKYLLARRARVSPPNWQAHTPHLTISKAHPGSSPPGGPWVCPSHPGQHQSQRSRGEGATTCNKSRSCGNPERVRVLKKSNQTTRKTKMAMSEDIWRNWNTDWL